MRSRRELEIRHQAGTTRKLSCRLQAWKTRTQAPSARACVNSASNSRKNSIRRVSGTCPLSFYKVCQIAAATLGDFDDGMVYSREVSMTRS